MATSDFGKEIKIRLVELDKNQAWLIEEVKKRTGAFFDSSWLWRIMSGAIPAESARNGEPSKAEIIRDILGLPQEKEE